MVIIRKYWFPVVGSFILLLTIISLFVIWQNIRNIENARRQELMDFAANISETSDVFLKNQQYEDFYKIINLLTHMSYVRYIAFFLNGTKVLQTGDQNRLEPRLLETMVREKTKVAWENKNYRLYINQALNYQREKSASVLTVFSLAEFQNSKRNIIYVSVLILILSLTLGACLFWWFKIHQTLSNVYKALEKSEDTKSRMIRAISHDSMHTLSAIYSTLFSVLNQKNGHVTPAQLRKDLKHIRENVHGIKRVLENLRDHERISRGQLNPGHQERIDLIYWLRFVIENYEVTLSQKEMELELVVPDQSVYVKADKESVKSILMNLLDNAIKYSENRKRIVVRIEVKDEMVKLFIQDQGFGMAPEDWERIFEPFVRLAHVDQQIEGSGLGLSNARQQIRQHQGDIQVVKSRRSAGTTLLVTLPLLKSR